MASDFKHKKVWVPDSYEGYLLGQIQDIGTDQVTVKSFKSQKIVTSSYDSVFPAEDDDSKDVDDNCGLMYLNEATLLNNIRLRYNRDQIYTYVANILIALNPYYSIPNLYVSDTIRRYQGKSLGVLPPHVFAIADKAYRDMKRLKESQSIIVSGESGAGKTESQKCILRYLCESWGSHAGPVEQRILETNPILEAFGNAKTLRNNNSSRFGKFVEIHFNQKLMVSGGFVSHYLLEKSRICMQQPGERNYHIFYQLCAGAPETLCQQLHIGSPDSYQYLKFGSTQFFCTAESEKALSANRLSALQRKHGALRDPVIDDIRDWRRLDAALGDIGFSNEERLSVYATVAALLHLGNVDFAEDPEDTRGGCCVSDKSKASLALAARLLGVDVDELQVGLISRTMQTAKGGIKGTVIRVPLKAGEAAHARDALAKAIYSRIFDHIVAKINACIPFGHSHGYIGVLDIAGFEYFTVNSFEQFCINYCNEKLQQFFNDRILKQEQELYEKEGLGVKRIDYVDNQDCIELIETKQSGILDLLDEESKLPRPSAPHFTATVHQTHKNHFRLAMPRKSKLREHRDIRDDEGFLVRHFAGAVCYSTALFIDKNNDALHASLEYLLIDSQSALLKKLFAVDDDENAENNMVNNHTKMYGSSKQQQQKQGKLGFVSVGSKFRSQLRVLMDKLESTGTHFVRCVKPNSKMQAHLFEGGLILSQLQCSGMGSVLKLMQQGFPSRTQFVELYKMYKLLLPPDLGRLEPRLFCKCLFKALGLNEQDYKFGLTKVFFRAGKFAEFDQMLRSDPENLAQLVKRVKKWLIRTRWKQAQYGAWMVVKLKRKIQWRRERLVKIQAFIRGCIARKRYRHKWRGILKVKKLHTQLTAMSQIVQKLHKDQSVWNGRVKELESSIQQLVVKIRDSPLNSGQIDSAYEQLVRNLNETLAQLRKQAELQSAEHERLRKVQEQMEREKKAREREAEEKRLADEQRRQKAEQDSRRKQEELEAAKEQQRLAAALEEERKKYEKEASKWTQAFEQERRDHDLAVRLAQESNSTVDDLIVARPKASLLIPATQQGGKRKHDLSSWRYAELRDIINTTTDIDLLEACRDEFHRRLKVYHEWKDRNQRTQTNDNARLPELVMLQNSKSNTDAGMMSGTTKLSNRIAAQRIQRFFRVPFARPGDRGTAQGWWYAHFDGQWIARQMEMHPDKIPLLLVAGRDDMQMCELSLDETGLTRKRGAEIMANEFEVEWRRRGGSQYVPPELRNAAMQLQRL